MVVAHTERICSMQTRCLVEQEQKSASIVDEYQVLDVSLPGPQGRLLVDLNQAAASQGRRRTIERAWPFVGASISFGSRRCSSQGPATNTRECSGLINAFEMSVTGT